MDDELKAAVAASYRVFGNYAFEGADLQGGAAVGPLEVRLLRLTPPGEVTRDLAAAFAAGLPALMNGRGADDLRALLPRLLELVADGALPAADALALLDLAQFRTRWADVEVQAVERFLGACGAPPETEPGPRPDG